MIELSNINIVLVETSHPGNIGATARAMKTMGLSHLSLVNPLKFPSAEASAMASGATDVLDNARVYSSLAQAVQDCHIVLGSTARRRDLSWPMYTPRTLLEHLEGSSPSAELAIVFGRERTGLTNEELWLCSGGIHIPCSAEYSSLNLAQAVQIIAYELRLGLLDAHPPVEFEQEELASHAAMEQFYQVLADLMIRTEFMRADEPKRLLPKLRRLFNRAQVSSSELNILRGILRQIDTCLAGVKGD